jgi:hypothetical protein
MLCKISCSFEELELEEMIELEEESICSKRKINEKEKNMRENKPY